MHYRRLRSSTFRHQAGDTIVEVLIAIAIVSSVLAGAFTVSSKSTRAVRDSQERAAMLQILQGQVELVRGMAIGDVPNKAAALYATAPSTPFCINTSYAIVPYTGSPINVPDLATTPPSGCGNLSGLYNVAITHTSSNQFDFVGWWARLGGGMNQMKLTYIIPPST